MAQNIKISEYTGKFQNPAVQLNTSVSQIMQESITLPQNDQALFTSDEVQGFSPLSDNTQPFRIFKVDDPLTYGKFDPKAQKLARDKAAAEAQSADNASNINPTLER